MMRLLWIPILLPIFACKTIADDPPKYNADAQAKKDERDLKSMKLTYPSFQAIPVDDRCSGLKVFAEEFVSQSMEGRHVADFQCSYDRALRDVDNEVTFLIKGGDDSFPIRAIFKNRLASQYMEISTLEQGRERSLNSMSPRSRLERELLILNPLLDAWMRSNEGKMTIRGKDYQTFIWDFQRNYTDPSSRADAIDNPRLDLILKGGDGSKTFGLVEYQEIADEYFDRETHNFMGCLEITCLNDGRSSYFILDDILVIQRPVLGGQTRGTRPSTWHAEYRITETGLKRLKAYRTGRTDP